MTENLFRQNVQSMLPKIEKPVIKVTGNDRVGSEILYKHEATLMVGTRANQIEYGDSKIFVDYQGLDSSYMIALKELFEKKIPFILVRSYQDENNVYEEHWKSDELIIHPHITKEYEEV